MFHFILSHALQKHARSHTFSSPLPDDYSLTCQTRSHPAHQFLLGLSLNHVATKGAEYVTYNIPENLKMVFALTDISYYESHSFALRWILALRWGESEELLEWLLISGLLKSSKLGYRVLIKNSTNCIKMCLVILNT